MKFKESVITCAARKPFNFRERASRSEYWWFALAAAVTGGIAGFISSLLSSWLELAVETGTVVAMPRLTACLLFLMFAIQVFLAVASTAAAVRRLHDTGRTGWWLAVPLACNIVFAIILVAAGVMALEEGGDLPGAMYVLLVILFLAAFASTVVNLVFLVLKGDPAENAWGPAPRS